MCKGCCRMELWNKRAWIEHEVGYLKKIVTKKNYIINNNTVSMWKCSVVKIWE